MVSIDKSLYHMLQNNGKTAPDTPEKGNLERFSFIFATGNYSPRARVSAAGSGSAPRNRR